MNGVATIRQLLTQDGELLALVPATRIMAGVLPLGTALPAIGISQVSSIDRNIVAPGAGRHVVDRVQVTVLAADYPELRAVLAAAKAAAADMQPTVAGITAVTVHSDGAGPDFMDEGTSLHAGTQDFRVEYNETR